MSRQGALVCGLVLMLAAALPALPAAAMKQHALEPSTHDAVGGVDLDEAPRDLERDGLCEEPTVSCGKKRGAAGRSGGKRSIVIDCHRFFELNSVGDAIMCLNNHRGWRKTVPKLDNWNCITTNVGLFTLIYHQCASIR